MRTRITRLPRSIPLLLALVTLACRAPDAATRPAHSRPYLDAARDTARWLRSCAMITNAGLAWPSDPNDPKSVTSNLYSGSAGVVLFFLELYTSTGDATALATARFGADELMSNLPEKVEGESAGLYTGIAGVGYTLYETYKTTGEEKYKIAADRCVGILESSANRDVRGADWGPVNDVIAGKAGIGLFLIYAAKRGHPRALDLAKRAGNRLVDAAHRDGTALWWDIEPSYKRNLPNFSHGTAGVAFFLAKLHHAIKDTRFAAAAVAGAQYLEKAADTSGGGFKVFHADPDGLDRYYLGWCHGPAGTARLFIQLSREDLGDIGLHLSYQCATAILASGIPEQTAPGFWNNVGQCCGSAGVAEFMLLTYGIHEDPMGRHAETPEHGGQSLALARRLTDDLLRRGVRDEHGLRWPQAEHRAKPELIVAQTGYAQGAAGIGLWLLHFDAFENGETQRIKLPDWPD